MINKYELIEWLSNIDAEFVGIDEGGLVLQSTDGNAYIEVGGI